MQVRKTNTWCLAVSLFLIIFLILINVDLAFAKDISLSYNEKVKVDKEFEIEIELVDFTDNNYDIKIDFDNRNFAVIWDDKWQSTYYYVKNAISSGKTKANLKLKIIEDFKGDKSFWVKIRKNGQSDFTKFGEFKIEVESRSGGESNDNSENQEEIIESSENTEQSVGAPKEAIENNGEIKLIDDEDDDTIYLTPISQNIKSEENNKITIDSRSNKIKDYIIYALVLFCIGIVILLIIDRRR